MFQLPTLEYLKKWSRKIHFFGLGFIQIKINDTLRFHFYTGKLESVVESIHNHRYNFTSYVLKGELVQEFFQPVAFVEGCARKPHTIDSVSCKPEKCGHRGEMHWTPMKTFEATLTQGSKYTISNSTYHRVRAESCITKIETGSVISEYAGVMRPIGEEPLCPFSKVVPTETLWEIVEDMLDV